MMEIKKFYATNLPTAMRDVRKALGPEAVILSTRSLPPNTGIHLLDGRATVEVTAAAGEMPGGGRAPSSSRAVAKSIAPIAAALPQVAARTANPAKAGPRPQPVAPAAKAAVKQSAISSIVSEIKSLRRLLGEKPAHETVQPVLKAKKPLSANMPTQEAMPGTPGMLRTNLIEPKPRSFDSRVSTPVATGPTTFATDEQDMFAELEEPEAYEMKPQHQPDLHLRAEVDASPPAAEPRRDEIRRTQFSPDLVLTGELFVKRLCEQGVNEELIKRILARMRFMSDGSAGNASGRSAEAGVNISYREFVDIVQGFLPPAPAHAEAKPRKIALVGPTGVGKTTTLAKLASRSSLYNNRKVGLVTLDTYRIAAAEQLKTYARLLGVPLEVVNDPKDLQEAFDRFSDADEIYVDTPGYSPKDTRGIERMASAFLPHPDLEVDLLITCATRDHEMRRILERFETTRFDRLIFTKMDEVSTLGDLLNTWIMGGYPVSYFTTGQRVPEDLEAALADSVCQRLLSPPDLWDRQNRN